MELWFGQEWEIAFSGVRPNGETIPVPVVLDWVDDTLVNEVHHVCADGNGWWLPNGSKLYRDASEQGQAHDELAGPECNHPNEFLRQEHAGERLMLALAGIAGERYAAGAIRVSKANVCGLSKTSWGSHENYEASKPVPVDPMLCWLACRILLTGSGGLDVSHPGIRFTISPRAHFFSEPVNNATQSGRGLHNVGKAHPYGKRHRVHVISGDGNRMALSSWLRIGATALAVACMDHGAFPGTRLSDPIAALRNFAVHLDHDVSSDATNGGTAGMTALLREFLTVCGDLAGRLPEWAPQVLDEWRRVLEAVARPDGWRSLARELDWAAKRALFERVILREGWTWQLLEEVNRRIVRRMELIAREDVPRHVSEQELLDKVWGEDAEGFFSLRRKLLELDARYMQLGPDSIHDIVARPPDHLKKIQLAVTGDPLHPPPASAGRAAIRARLIGEHGFRGLAPPDSPHAFASWTRFMVGNQSVDLPDVGGTDELVWMEADFGILDDVYPSLASRLEHRIRRVVNRASSALDIGNYRHAITELAQIDAVLTPSNGQPTAASRWTYSVRLAARAQDAVMLEQAIERLEACETSRIEVLWETGNARALEGLAGHESVPRLVSAVWEELRNVARPRPSGMACWKSHLAVWLIRHGRLEQAWHTLQSTKMNNEYGQTSDSVRARIEAQYGEFWRLQGDFDQARTHFDESIRLCEAGGLLAHMADYAQTGMARLLAEEGNPAGAADLLRDKVFSYQSGLGMPSSLRTCLLLARLQNPDDHPQLPGISRSWEHPMLACSGFARCSRLAKIQTHWDAWLTGAPDLDPDPESEAKDFFWGI